MQTSEVTRIGADAPRYRHHCSSCVFLGCYQSKDLYFCNQGGFEATVMARHGDDGGDYASAMCFSYGAIPALTEARRRAQEKGVHQYKLIEALGRVEEDAPQWVRDELKRHLGESELYDILKTLQRDEEAGTAAVHEYLQARVAVFAARGHEKSRRTMLGWVIPELNSAQLWTERFGMQGAEEVALTRAICNAIDAEEPVAA
jgi:integrase